MTWHQWAQDPIVLKAALRREEELRTCKAQQDLYAQVEDGCGLDWIDLADQLQCNVVREFLGTTLIDDMVDTKELMQNALGVLRTAHQRYPEDPEFRTIPLYVRYNRARRGTLVAGDIVPDVQLVPFSTASVSTSKASNVNPVDFWKAMFGERETTTATNKPLLIIASSWT